MDLNEKRQYEHAGGAVTQSRQDRGPNLTRKQRRFRFIRQSAPLFLQRGYDNVSMNDIIEAAGGSKATVYTLFGSKEGLFKEVVHWMAAGGNVFIDASGEGSLEEQLTRLGTSFLEMVLQPQILELHRLMVYLGKSFPEASALFYDSGPQMAYDIVTEWVTEKQRADAIGPGDPSKLAAFFLDMLIAQFQLSLLTGARERPTHHEIVEKTSLAARVFLHGCGAQNRLL